MTPSAGARENNSLSRELRGFGPAGIAALLVILLLGPPWFRAILVLIWARLSRTSWRDLGFVRPGNWGITVMPGLFSGIILKFLLKAVVMPLISADPINRAYHYLAGNTAAIPAMVLIIIVSAGFGEETVFRGFLFERSGKLFGHSRTAMIGIVLLTSVLFAAAHYPDQGIFAVEQAFFTGLFFGSVFAITANLWLVIVAHAAFDLTALAMIYYDVEWQIAHWIFK
jgi:membrane protease YdiL (CAAX protease family)